MDSIKDSTFLNVKDSIEDLETAMMVPKIAGSRRAAKQKEDEVDAGAHLKEDIRKMVCNALSQHGKVEQVPGLNAAQVTGLRALYGIINNGKSTEKDLGMAVQTVVELLNSEFVPKVLESKQDGVEEEKDLVAEKDLVTKKDLVTTGVAVRRSGRLAKLERHNYDEEEVAEFEGIFQDEDEEGDEEEDQMVDEQGGGQGAGDEEEDQMIAEQGGGQGAGEDDQLLREILGY